MYALKMHVADLKKTYFHIKNSYSILQVSALMGRSGVWGYKLILGIRMSPCGLWIGCAVRMPRCDAPRQATSFHDMRRHATTCHDMTTHDIILCVISRNALGGAPNS